MADDPEPTDDALLETARKDFHRAADFSLRVSGAVDGQSTNDAGELASCEDVCERHIDRAPFHVIAGGSLGNNCAMSNDNGGDDPLFLSRKIRARR